MNQHEMFTEVVANVAKMCAVSAMTAPKSGGQLFLKGSKPFIETTIVQDKETLHRLAEWLRARGTKLKNPIFFRDADTTEKVDLILFIGLEKWYPPMYDCGACGYGTCNEFLRATPAHHTQESEDWEFLGPICQLRCVDLGIAVGSAAKLASMNNVDTRCQTRVAAAARHLGIIHSDLAVALSKLCQHREATWREDVELRCSREPCPCPVLFPAESSRRRLERFPKVPESSPQLVRVAAKSKPEVVVHPKEASLRDDGLVPLQEGVCERADVDEAVREQDGPERRHLGLECRHFGERLPHDLPVSGEDSAGSPEEELPPFKRPPRDELSQRGVPARGVVLDPTEPLQEIRFRNDPTGPERAEPADLRDRGEGDHPRPELRDARRPPLKRQLAERLIDQHVRLRLRCDLRHFSDFRPGERFGGRIAQIRRHEETRPGLRLSPPTIQVEAPSVVAGAEDSDHLSTEARRHVPQGRVDR